MKIFDYIIKKGDLVFDVGLNEGSKSRLFLDLGAKVVGFEPQRTCYENAIKNLGENTSFIAENIALDMNKGYSDIYIASYHTISSMSEAFIRETSKQRFRGFNWGQKVSVETDTLDNMILKYGTPKFIKIDVEGYELNVLRGLTREIDFISIEFNPELKTTTFECIEYLDSIYSKPLSYNYGYRDDTEFKFNEWLTKGEIYDFLQPIVDYEFEFGDVYIKISK